MITTTNILKSILSEFFCDRFYEEGMTELRNSVKENKSYSDEWGNIIKLIINRCLKTGEPLYMLHNDANLPLFKNTDEEAYRWLTLMLINAVQPVGAPIIDYKDFPPNENREKV